ncbi:MAG: transposase [Candidatus Omnitrophota bacterium]
MDKKNRGLAQAKGKRHREILRYELKKYLERRSSQKIFTFRLTARGKSFHINYRVSERAIQEAAILNGLYVIMSSVKGVNAETLISAYQSRMEIERSFYQLKSFVEIRPIYHHNEERIRAHVSVCVLAYLLNNTVTHLVRQKKDFDDLTAQSVYGYLRSCKLVELNAGGEKRLKITSPTKEQIRLTEILSDKDLLNEEKVQKVLKQLLVLKNTLHE